MSAAAAAIRERRLSGSTTSTSAPRPRKAACACGSDSIGTTAVTQPPSSGTAVASTAAVTAWLSRSRARSRPSGDSRIVASPCCSPSRNRRMCAAQYSGRLNPASRSNSSGSGVRPSTWLMR
jgi:hypothetical protein